MEGFTPNTHSKITFIIHWFAGGGGGAERVAANLLNHFASRGRDVDLLVFSGESPHSSMLCDKVNLVNLPVKLKRFWLYRPGTWLALARYFKSAQPKYVLSSSRHVNISVGLNAYLYKPEHLFFREINTLDEVNNRRLTDRLMYRLLMKLSYRKADGVIANSNDTRDDLVKYGIVPASKITVIQNPVIPPDHEELAAVKISEPWLADNSLRVVLGVGRLTYQKNFPFLVRAFSLVYEKDRRARLIILGHGPERPALQALIDELKLDHVAKILEFQNNIYPYFVKASVFALSSRWEGFGNVLVESLSVGTPVVSIDCPGGPRTILEDGRYGTLVKPGDLDGFSSAIIDTLNRPALHSDLLVQRSRAFAVDVIAEQYAAFMGIPAGGCG